MLDDGSRHDEAREARVRRRLDNGRREELLDGVMAIVAARGFSEVRTAQLARDLHCSESSLYKIAPSKDSLIVLAIGHWGEVTLAAMEAEAKRGKTASDRARAYFRAGARHTRTLSPAFYVDMERFESARLAWWTSVVEPYLDRFVELVQMAEDAGEIRPVNIRFLAEVVRQLSVVTRSERILSASGLTHEQAVLEIDALLWGGVRKP
jgi:AcrR family transcriptional regulator